MRVRRSLSRFELLPRMDCATGVDSGRRYQIVLLSQFQRVAGKLPLLEPIIFSRCRRGGNLTVPVLQGHFKFAT